MGNDLKVIDKRIQEEPEQSFAMTTTSPAEMIQMALSKGLDTEKLEKMLLLQEQWEKNEAKKAYVAAMAEFKKNPPEIEKDKTVSYEAGGKEVRYAHASLSNVTNKINAGLGEHGLSAAWVTAQKDKDITVTCTITHNQGHAENTSLTAAPDISGSKNAIQAIGSTISYLERYTLLALTGLATSDMDDDGKGTENQEKTLTEEQIANMEALRSEVKADGRRLLKWLKIDKVEDLPQSKYAMAIKHLEAKRGQTDAENN